MELHDKIIGIVVEKLGIDKAKIMPDSYIESDLGADSIDKVELIMACEDEFNITIPDQERSRRKL